MKIIYDLLYTMTTAVHNTMLKDSAVYPSLEQAPVLQLAILEYNPANYLQWIMATVEYLSQSAMIYMPFYDQKKETIYSNILVSAPTKHYYKFELIAGTAYITYSCMPFYVKETIYELTGRYHSIDRKEQKNTLTNTILNSETHVTQFANVYYVQYDLSGRIDKYT